MYFNYSLTHLSVPFIRCTEAMAFLPLSMVSDGKRICGMHSRCLIAATSLCAQEFVYIDSREAATRAISKPCRASMYAPDAA